MTGVRHDSERSRYELVVDDEVAGLAEYYESDGVLVFLHTEVDFHRQGQGFGSTLVQGALDAVRHSGRTIVARCPFVAHFLDEHPEYRDLVAG